MSEPVRNAQVANHTLRTFVIDPLVYISERANITLKITTLIEYIHLVPFPISLPSGHSCNSTVGCLSFFLRTNVC